MLLALFGHVPSRLLGWVESLYLQWTELSYPSPTEGIDLDLSRSKSELLLENALLRQQLVILQRQVKQVRFTRRERLSLLILASRLPNWRQLLLTLKPAPLSTGTARDSSSSGASRAAPAEVVRTFRKRLSA